MTTLTLLLLSILPHSGEPVEDRCDAIIAESFYDGCGKLVFVQHIFLDEVVYPSGLVSEVVGWRLVRAPDQIVQREDGGWFILWNDGGTLRRLRARSYHETHSQIDSELAARETLPPEHRRGLRGERKP